MNEILNLIEKSSEDFQIDDYKKIKELCEKKISDKLLIENIEFIKRIQQNKNIWGNIKILSEFRELINNYTSNSEFIFNSFVNYNFENIKDMRRFNNFCKSIRCFDLSGTCMNLYDENKKKHNIEEIIDNSGLYTSLDLSYNNIYDQGIEVLYQILVKEIYLQEINLTNCGLSDKCISKLEELIENNPSIKKIIIQRNNITNKTSKYPDVIIF